MLCHPLYSAASLALLVLANTSITATVITRDPLCAAGNCEVDGFDIFGASVGVNHDFYVDFLGNQTIELLVGPTTTIEFGIGNTGGSAALDYRIVFDLTDQNGQPLTNDLLVVDETAPAGFYHIKDLPLTNLPPATSVYGFRVSVDTECAVPGSCTSFDLLVAGGGGGGGAVSGPIHFNRTVNGLGVPEPTSLILLSVGLISMGLFSWRYAGLQPTCDKLC